MTKGILGLTLFLLSFFLFFSDLLYFKFQEGRERNGFFIERGGRRIILSTL